MAKFAVQAAQQTLAKAQSGAAPQSAPPQGGASQGAGTSEKHENAEGGALSIFTAKLGPLPRYAYVLIAGAAYGGYRVLRRAK